MNLKRCYRLSWALSTLARRCLFKDPVALYAYLAECERLKAQLWYKQDQHFIRVSRRQDAIENEWNKGLVK
jgi:hypothetical protein